MDSVHRPVSLLLAASCPGAEESLVAWRTTRLHPHQTRTRVNGHPRFPFAGGVWRWSLELKKEKNGFQTSCAKYLSARSKETLNSRVLVECCFKNKPCPLPQPLKRPSDFRLGVRIVIRAHTTILDERYHSYPLTTDFN